MGYEMNTGTQVPTFRSNIAEHSEGGYRTFGQNTGYHLADSLSGYDSQHNNENSGSNTIELPSFFFRFKIIPTT
jgi:hypothetical protein